MAETTITRTRVITVGEVGQNTYGDLTFTDLEGTAYKVAVKRKQYFEKVIVPDETVQLNYAMSSFGKEYIYSAVRSTETPTKPSVEKPVSPPAEILPKPEKVIPGEQIGMTTKEIGDMIRAGKLRDLFGAEVAVELVKWYRGQILGTTKVPFDGAKLPQYKIETAK